MSEHEFEDPGEVSAARVDIPPPISRLMDAAAANDQASMHAVLDYSLTGAARMVRALCRVDEKDRERVARSGLSEIDAATSSPTIPDEVLPLLARLVRQLGQTRSVRVATAEEAAAALNVAHVPDAPSGLSPAITAGIDQLQAMARRVERVYVATSGAEQAIWLALSPDSDRVVYIDNT